MKRPGCLLTAAATIGVAGGGLAEMIIRLVNPRMTETQLLLEYWPVHLLLLLSAWRVVWWAANWAS